MKEFCVNLMCKVLEVSSSGFYAWCKRPESLRLKQNRALVTKIKAIHAQSRETYGSPRVWDRLQKQGLQCSRTRVARLMNKAGIRSVHRSKFKPQTTDSKHTNPIACNVLEQDFKATAPNQKWAGDITYIKTSQGWLYLAVVLDLYSRKVIGWAMSSSPNAALVCKAFDMAVFRRRKPRAFIFHSDRGSQYASFKFRNRLKQLNITCSMSRKANCYDNSVVESFFHTLKVEHVHRYKYASREIARKLIADYIEEFYNTNRAHSTLGYCSPVEFEDKFKHAA